MRFQTLKRITEPSVEPLTLSETKSHLRVEHSDDDTVISGMILTAREYCETYLDQTLITTQWQMTLDVFPQFIALPRGPMSTATGYKDVAVTYLNDQGQTVTLPTSDYRIDYDSVPGILYPNFAESWPAHRSDHNSITIQYWAGYGVAGSDVPRSIRHAMLMLTTHLYENRSSVHVGQQVTVVPSGFNMLLDSCKHGGYQ